jgi:hypothetical protein
VAKVPYLHSPVGNEVHDAVGEWQGRGDTCEIALMKLRVAYNRKFLETPGRILCS